MSTIEPGRYEPHSDTSERAELVAIRPEVWVVLERSADEGGLEQARPVAVFTEVVAALRFVADSDHSMFVVSVPHLDATSSV